MDLSNVFMGTGEVPSGEELKLEIAQMGGWDSTNVELENVHNVELENILNAILYDKDENGIAHSKYAEIINNVSKAVTDSLLDTVSKIDVNAETVSASEKVTGVDANAHISIDNLRSVEEELKNNLKIIMKKARGSDKAEEVKKVVNEINKKIISQIQKVLKMFPEGSTGFNLTTSNVSGDFHQLRINYELLKKLTIATNAMPDVNALGEVFELTLTKAIKQLKNNATSELLEVFTGAKATHAGSDFVARTKKGGMISVMLDSSGLKTIGKDIPKHMQNISVSGKGFDMVVTPMSQRQSKADVIIKFPEDSSQSDMGLSLKNWNDIFKSNKKYGIGETTILSAVIRSAGIDNAENYALSLLMNYGGATEASHMFAQLCIAADIVMGYAQENNWASDLVINDRTAKQIFVYNIPALIMNMGTALEIINYPFGELDKNALSILHSLEIKSPGRTTAYIRQMFAILQSHLVTVRLNESIIKKT